jgi:hypothetical protein
MTRKGRRQRTGVVRLGLCLAGLLGASSVALAPALVAAERSLPQDIKGCVLWLKADAGVEAAWGRSFHLQRYHHRLLSFGSPPTRFIRALMLDLPISTA